MFHSHRIDTPQAHKRSEGVGIIVQERVNSVRNVKLMIGVEAILEELFDIISRPYCAQRRKPYKRTAFCPGGFRCRNLSASEILFMQ